MIKFKTDRIKLEWVELEKRNLRLYSIVNRLNTYCETEYLKPLTITCIYRSPKENAALYAPGKEPTRRPHTLWEGVDLRSTDWTKERIQAMLAQLNSEVVYGGKHRCGSVHAVPGNVDHFHVNAPAKEPSPSSTVS